MATHNRDRHIPVMPKAAPKKIAAPKLLPNKIRKWRDAAGYTLEKAAEEIGQTAGNLSAIERGTQGYSDKTLKALAKLYGAKEPGYLLSVDPTDDIFPIWNDANEAEREQIMKVARALTGKSK